MEWVWFRVKGKYEESPSTIRILMIFLTLWQFFSIFQIATAMNVPIIFWHKFLSLLAEFIESRKLKELTNWLPSTYNEALNILGLDSGAYVVPDTNYSLVYTWHTLLYCYNPRTYYIIITDPEHTVRGKYLEGENIGEFGKFVAFCQIFTLQMSENVLFYYPNIACKSKCANILPSKS